MKTTTNRNYLKVLIVAAVMLMVVHATAFAATYTIRLHGYIAEKVSVSVEYPDSPTAVALDDGTLGWDAGRITMAGNVDTQNVQVVVASADGSTTSVTDGRVTTSAS